MSDDIAIKVDHLSKIYKIFDRPVDRLKESLSPFHKRYSRDFYALQDVSFEVRRGETLGIIGKNGAGKSTLLKVITGVLTATHGDICVNGRIASLLELGAGFNPEMTGIENIYMSGTVMGYSKEEMDSRLSDIVSFADIGDFIHQPVKMYSSGMFARLAFAVNSHVNPDILIVDEALSVGDIFFQNKCFRKFRELRDNGVTIIFVSHDLSSVRQLTSRLLWLERGKRRMFGDMESVCDAYFREQVQIQNENVHVAVDVESDKMETVRQAEGKYLFPHIIVKQQAILSKKACIESFFFQDSSGNRLERLQSELEYTVVFVARFLQPMENLIFGFNLETNKGIQILGVNSFINNQEKLINIDHPEIIGVNFKFKLPRILHGEYLVTPAIATGLQNEHSVLTWLPGASKVIIDNDGYNLSLLEIPAKIWVEEYNENQIDFIK